MFFGLPDSYFDFKLTDFTAVIELLTPKDIDNVSSVNMKPKGFKELQGDKLWQ